jgi:hypothetical protein
MIRPPELDGPARAIIAAGCGGHEPNELARARVRKRLDARLAAGLALVIAPASSAFAAVVKVAAVAFAAGALATGGVALYRRPAKSPAPAAVHDGRVRVRPTVAIAAPTPSMVDDIARQVDQKIQQQIQQQTQIDRQWEAGSATAGGRGVRPRHHIRIAAEPDHVPAPFGLADETALLVAANAALARHDPTGARALLAVYDHRGASGALLEERTATGILTACALGRVHEATAEASRFHTRWPRSPLTGRVDASCAGHPSAATVGP